MPRAHGEIFEEKPKINSELLKDLPALDHFHVGHVTWSEERRQRLSSRYILSESQRSMILQEEIENDSERNDDILKKRDLLPERIQHLLEDIAILFDSPYFSEEAWDEGLIDRKQGLSPSRIRYEALQSPDVTSPEDMAEVEQKISAEIDHYEPQVSSQEHLWKQLLDLTPWMTQVRDDDVFISHYEKAEPEFKFGFEMGTLLQALRTTSNDQRDPEDLLWGFILAFIGRPQDAVAEEEEELEALVDEFRDRQNKRSKKVEKFPMPDNIDDHDQEREYVEQAIREGIKDTETAPHPIIVREVEHHHPMLTPTGAEESESLEVTSEDVAGLSPDEVEAYFEEIGNDLSKEEAADLNREEAASIVRDLKEVTPLEEAEDLYETISKDIEVVTSRSVPGIDSALRALEGLEKVRVGDGSEEDDESGWKRVTSHAVEKEIQCHKDRVTETFNHLTDDSDKELWTAAPVLHRNSGTERGQVWSLTAYGEVLTYCCLESGSNADWIFRFALGPEELALAERKMVIEALDELGDL